VEGLRGEDGVDRRIDERDFLTGSGQRLGLRAKRFEPAAHRLGRLDGDHSTERGDEQARELSRARAEVEHGRGRWEAGEVDHLRRPAGPAALVVLGPGVAAASRHAPGISQRWRQAKEGTSATAKSIRTGV